MLNAFRQKFILVLEFLVIITAVTCNDAVSSSQSIEPSPRIVGGEEINIVKHPYVVSVRRKACVECAYEHYCGGTIFSDDVIITAAKCVADAEPQRIHIVAGSSLRTGSLQDGGMIFPVSKMTLHPDSNVDLALLNLALKIPLNSSSLKTQAVSLASRTPSAGTLATIVGWGQIAENGPYSERLREAVVPIVEQQSCMKAFEKDTIKEYEICAGFPNGGVDACDGDAGGPLLVDGQMVGVTSWGNDCARPNSPGVYTNVVQLSEWIVSHALGVRISFL